MTTTTPREPFAFQPDEDGTLTISSAVHQAIGAASVCWESMTGTGLFQEDRAQEIAAALLEEIARTGGPSHVVIRDGVRLDGPRLPDAGPLETSASWGDQR